MTKSSKAGGGINSNQRREIGMRQGAPRRAVSVKGASRIGSSMGNKATEKSGALRGAVEPVMNAGRAISAPLGNAVALNVAGGGPGKGRNLYGQSGSQAQHGAPAGQPRPQGRGIMNNE